MNKSELKEMKVLGISPVYSLAHALFDVGHTARLAEQPQEVFKEYEDQAADLLYMIREYRPFEEKLAIMLSLFRPDELGKKKYSTY